MPSHQAEGRCSKGVLFDVDGTLVDSSYIHTLAWWQAFRQAGFDVPMARSTAAWEWAAPGWWTTCCRRSATRPATTPSWPAHSAVFGTYWPSLRAFDGARDLLAQCYESGLAVALASSAKDADLKALRAHARRRFLHPCGHQRQRCEGKQARAGHTGGGAPRGGPRGCRCCLRGGCGVGRAGGQQARHPHHRGHVRRHERG